MSQGKILHRGGEETSLSLGADQCCTWSVSALSGDGVHLRTQEDVPLGSLSITPVNSLAMQPLSQGGVSLQTFQVVLE